MLERQESAESFPERGFHVLWMHFGREGQLMSPASSAISHRQSAKADQAALADDPSFLRIKEALFGRDMAWLARETGISPSALSDLRKGKRPSVDRAVKIARALSRSVEWLFDGGAATTQLLDAAEADWVSLPRYDLRTLTDSNKGDQVEAVPMRRDWLNRRLLTSTGLWITELPSDYEALGLAEGDVVVCSDIIRGDGPQEKWICIFRGPGGPFVARYSNRPSGEGRAAGEMLDDVIVTANELATADNYAVARIHARMLARV